MCVYESHIFDDFKRNSNLGIGVLHVKRQILMHFL